MMSDLVEIYQSPSSVEVIVCKALLEDAHIHVLRRGNQLFVCEADAEFACGLVKTFEEESVSNTVEELPAEPEVNRPDFWNLVIGIGGFLFVTTLVLYFSGEFEALAKIIHQWLDHR